MAIGLEKIIGEKGIATEALKQTTDYVFNNFPDLVRLWAAVFEYNKPSMNVLEKAGFELEGIRKKGAIKNGRVIDEYVYVKFRDHIEMIERIE